MKYNEKEKSIQASVKLFTNDLEDALKKIYKQKVDLINGANKEELKNLLSDYIAKHFNVKLNGKEIKFETIGFEREEEAVWIFIEYKNCNDVTKISIEDSLLYDFIASQINIVSFEMDGKKQSTKVTNPEKLISFDLK